MCGESLNPIWVLSKFSQAENRMHMRIAELGKDAKKAESKNRCKCEHCGKLTKIQK